MRDFSMARRRLLGLALSPLARPVLGALVPGLKPGALSAALEGLAQSQRSDAPARVADPPWLREAREDVAALSRRIPGSDFALISWYGAAPFDVSDRQHLAVMNRSSSPIHAFLIEEGNGPRRGVYNVNGEAREVSERPFVVNLPSDELGTRIPNLARGKPGHALVSYGKGGRQIKRLSELGAIAAEPLDPLNADYWLTPRARQPRPREELQAFRWIKPGLGDPNDNILSVTHNPDNGRVSILYNTHLATFRQRYDARRSVLGPHIMRTFTAAQLGREAFTAENQRTDVWRNMREQMLDRIKRNPWFVLERQTLIQGPAVPGATRKWVAEEQKYSGLQLKRENGRLKIDGYFIGG